MTLEELQSPSYWQGSQTGSGGEDSDSESASESEGEGDGDEEKEDEHKEVVHTPAAWKLTNSFMTI